MMRLIDADRLLKMMAHWKPYMDMYYVRRAVEHMPTIDAVPVVRCGECIYKGRVGDQIIFCKNFERDMIPDDFCSCGERKDGAE